MLKKRLRKIPSGVGAGIVAFWLFVAYILPIFVDLDPLATFPVERLSPPSAEFLLGTDQFGRSMLDRIAAGARISLEVGAFTTILAAAIGITIGLIGGYVKYLGGLLMRVTDGLMAFPGALFAIVLVAVFGQGFLQIVFALTVTFVPTFARITYGEVLALQGAGYVRNAVSVGCTTPRVIVRHILPNLIPSLIVQATFVCATAIIVEASLGFIGAGLAPPDPSWGVMVSEGQAFMRVAWWVLVFPCLAIASLIFGLCLLGDKISDRVEGRGAKTGAETAEGVVS
ncbi:ABC transporter permease [Arthrobacter sp. B1805]|uniref:ABC transporter permease n=1 Tax=Arthrobacter sp. B1805 TaxID=2058892 RepID=UPI000CE31609|nr:ABC transporter permease [Arthrobacter sp. B1805]